MRSGQPAGAGYNAGDDEGEGACLGAVEDEDCPPPGFSDLPL